MKENNLIYFFNGLLRSANVFLNSDKTIKNIKKYSANEKELDYINDRVNYYCRIDKPFSLKDSTNIVKDFKWPFKKSAYKIDSYEYLRLFGNKQPVNVEFGDVNYFLPQPTLVKSRPIRCSLNNEQDSKNSILFKINKRRHFSFIYDGLDFNKKYNTVYWRCGVYQEHRKLFFNYFFNDPLCDLGHVGKKNLYPEWEKPKASISEQLKHKFILALEGNDVATNLKWIMSSNSIAIMPKPKFETWFMEGKLIGGIHYIEIKEDYSDLHEVINYYLNNIDECYKIIENANTYVEQFKNREREDLISILVLEKYFSLAF